MLLLYLRLLGPTVPQDVVMRPWMASLSFSQVLSRGWPLLAMLAATRLTTWRSHELPPGRSDGGQRCEVSAGAGGGPRRGKGPVPGRRRRVAFQCHPGAAQVPVASRSLWQQIAGLDIGAIWRRIARWLLRAPEHTPPVAFMTMLWGSLGNVPRHGVWQPAGARRPGRAASWAGPWPWACRASSSSARKRTSWAIVRRSGGSA